MDPRSDAGRSGSAVGRLVDRGVPPMIGGSRGWPRWVETRPSSLRERIRIDGPPETGHHGRIGLRVPPEIEDPARTDRVFAAALERANWVNRSARSPSARTSSISSNLRRIARQGEPSAASGLVVADLLESQHVARPPAPSTSARRPVSSTTARKRLPARVKAADGHPSLSGRSAIERGLEAAQDGGASPGGAAQQPRRRRSVRWARRSAGGTRWPTRGGPG